jgi:hypothetical protein
VVVVATAVVDASVVVVTAVVVGAPVVAGAVVKTVVVVGTGVPEPQEPAVSKPARIKRLNAALYNALAIFPLY